MQTMMWSQNWCYLRRQPQPVSAVPLWPTTQVAYRIWDESVHSGSRQKQTKDGEKVGKAKKWKGKRFNVMPFKGTSMRQFLIP
jgi:hypothetical protein